MSSSGWWVRKCFHHEFNSSSCIRLHWAGKSEFSHIFIMLWFHALFGDLRGLRSKKRLRRSGRHVALSAVISKCISPCSKQWSKQCSKQYSKQCIKNYTRPRIVNRSFSARSFTSSAAVGLRSNQWCICFYILVVLCSLAGNSLSVQLMRRLVTRSSSSFPPRFAKMFSLLSILDSEGTLTNSS